MFSEAVTAALDAVSSLSEDDPLRPIAFQEVLRAALAHSVAPGAARAALNAPTSRAGTATSGAHGIGDPLSRIEEKVGLPIATIERVYDFGDGEFHLTIESARLRSTRSGGTEDIALLVCAGRQAGLAESETTHDVIKQVCDDFGRLDDTNFATTLRGLTGVLVLGGTPRARTYRLTRPGFERVRELIRGMFKEGI